MLRIFFVLMILLPPTLGYALGDTVFFNKYWVVTTRDKAHFYRPKPVKVKGSKLYQVTDFYMNGNKQMEGFTHKIEQPHVEGEGYTKYYNEGGT